MPKQDKEGGINPAFDVACFVFQNSAAGRQSAAPLLSLSSSVACSNKRETRVDLYPESWTFFKRDSVISGIELDS